MTNPGEVVNATLTGSEGGVVESVKRAVIRAVREALTGTSIDDDEGTVRITVNFEYPIAEEEYPGIWVQFSLRKLERVGIAHEILPPPTIENEGTEDEWKNWEPIQEWAFEGMVTLTIVALSSLHRDRISDRLITLLAFSRQPDHIITDRRRDIKQYKVLMRCLEENPYVSLTINSDQLVTGGQAVNVGVPWNPERLAYEDTYSFAMLGQFNVQFKHDGTYTLHRVDYVPEMWDPHDWH